MRHCSVLAMAMLTVSSGSAWAAGDYPLASCSGWGATIIDIVGVDGRNARMEGAITKADMREFCDRDPGGETVQYGGALTTDQCAEKYWAQERNVTMTTTADCGKGQLVFMQNGHEPQSVRFPLGPDADTSCASGMPPFMAQFRIVCPMAAARLGVE